MHPGPPIASCRKNGDPVTLIKHGAPPFSPAIVWRPYGNILSVAFFDPLYHHPAVYPGLLSEALLEKPAPFPVAKAVYSILILVANLPAVAVYLLATGKPRPAPEAAAPPPQRRKTGSRQGIFVLLLIAYEIFTFPSSLRMPAYRRFIGWWALALCLMAMIAIGLQTVIGGGALRLSAAFAANSASLFGGLSRSRRRQPYLVLAIVAALANGLPLRSARLCSIAAFILYCWCRSFARQILAFRAATI